MLLGNGLSPFVGVEPLSPFVGVEPRAPVVGGEPSLLAPRVGLEPTTLRLTAECSTIELPGNSANDMLL